MQVSAESLFVEICFGLGATTLSNCPNWECQIAVAESGMQGRQSTCLLKENDWDEPKSSEHVRRLVKRTCLYSHAAPSAKSKIASSYAIPSFQQLDVIDS